ncbi:hypothetical protein PENTCL1PPCAC_14926 [Pristionchus entomophagus]|uniref:Uncharacterized protein n=1 Tax=Pristionchus entomophagus TaxID=358040 RepID=A0AAV5TGV5_9BILA|nr:hypothetical protein PENTCL1PPCAC_14926 [Pristionchus entomophagus]
MEPGAAPFPNPIFIHSESMFSNAFRMEQEQAHRMYPSTTFIPNNDLRVGMEEEDERSEMVATMMVAYLNSCLGKAKNSLLQRGVVVSTVDAKGMRVDFSSRPIDRIFKVARARLEHDLVAQYVESLLASDVADDPMVGAAASSSSYIQPIDSKPSENNSDSKMFFTEYQI